MEKLEGLSNQDIQEDVSVKNLYCTDNFNNYRFVCPGTMLYCA